MFYRVVKSKPKMCYKLSVDKPGVFSPRLPGLFGGGTLFVMIMTPDYALYRELSESGLEVSAWFLLLLNIILVCFVIWES